MASTRQTAGGGTRLWWRGGREVEGDSVTGTGTGAPPRLIPPARRALATVLLCANRIACGGTSLQLPSLPTEMWEWLLGMFVLESASFSVSTVAGVGGVAGCADGKASLLYSPGGLCVDPLSGLLYVADTFNHRIRVVTPEGNVETLAGGCGFTGVARDGPFQIARFCHPQGICFDPDPADPGIVVSEGRYLDPTSHRVRRLSLRDRTVTTLAGHRGRRGSLDGPAATAQFQTPSGLAVAADGSVIVADRDNNKIRRIHKGEVTTVAGDGTFGSVDGPAGACSFREPTGVAVTPDGAVVVAEQRGHRLRVISRNGSVSTLAGGNRGFVDGPAATAQFKDPTAIAIDPAGDLLIADTLNDRLRRLRFADRHVTTVTGGGYAYRDGDVAVARLNAPCGLAVHNGVVYVADRGNHAIRAVRPNGEVEVVALGVTSTEGGGDGRRRSLFSLRGWWWDTLTGPHPAA